MSWKYNGLIFQSSGQFGWIIYHTHVLMVHVMDIDSAAFFQPSNAVEKSLSVCIGVDKNKPTVSTISCPALLSSITISFFKGLEPKTRNH